MAGPRKPISAKAGRLTESVIREMTRQAILHDAVNLSQGFPDFAAPEKVKHAAREAIAADYRDRRNALLAPLRAAGFRCFVPRGATYFMTGIEAFGFDDDLAFTDHLVKEIGLAVVPGSSFYSDPRDGARQVRFAFCKKPPTLDEAARRLRRLRPPA